MAKQLLILRSMVAVILLGSTNLIWIKLGCPLLMTTVVCFSMLHI